MQEWPKSRRERWLVLSRPIISPPTALLYGCSKLSTDKLTREWLCHELASCLVPFKPDDQVQLTILALTSN